MALDLQKDDVTFIFIYSYTNPYKFFLIKRRKENFPMWEENEARYPNVKR